MVTGNFLVSGRGQGGIPDGLESDQTDDEWTVCSAKHAPSRRAVSPTSNHHCDRQLVMAAATDAVKYEQDSQRRPAAELYGTSQLTSLSSRI